VANTVPLKDLFRQHRDPGEDILKSSQPASEQVQVSGMAADTARYPRGASGRAGRVLRSAVTWLLCAVLIDALVALLGVTVFSGDVGTSWLIAGPLFASARLKPSWTALVSLFALGLVVPLSVYGQGVSPIRSTLPATTVVIGGVFATYAAYSREKRERALTDIAQTVQQALLHPIAARIGGVGVATRYRSATEGAMVGGDLYDIANTPFGLRVIIGDVRGKGLHAIELSAATIGYFRDCAYTEPSLRRVVRDIDGSLTHLLGEEDFVTAVIAEFGDGKVSLANCGHHPPMHVGERLVLLPAADPSPPLGLGPDPEIQLVPLGEGERLLFYTDGVAEARDTTGRMFDIRRGLEPVIRDCDLEKALADVVHEVDRHTGGMISDDIALVLTELGTSCVSHPDLSGEPEHLAVPGPPSVLVPRRLLAPPHRSLRARRRRVGRESEPS
jgi:phosphoserine phosphatase RsbU/P